MKLEFTSDVTLGKGYDEIETFQVGNVNFLFCHNIQSGESKIWNLDKGGNPVFERKTFAGWTSFVFFKLDRKTYLFEFKKETGHHNVYIMNSDGSIGDVVKDKAKWSAGWTDFDVMYDNNNKPNLIMMNASNGRAKIFKPSF
ncbi:MAG: hypothetical protein ACOCWC_05045 [Bacteroidota bacterium]